MLRILRRVAWLFLAALLAWLLIVATDLLPRIPADAAAAVAELRRAEPAPDAASGGNLFDRLWLLRYGVPAAERQALVDADLARAAAAPGPVEPAAAARYAQRPVLAAAEPALCMDADADCLAHVRTDPTATRVRLDQLASLRTALLELHSGGHYRERWPPRLDAPVPGFTPEADVLPRTEAALRVVEGDLVGGLEHLCRHAALWRRVRADTDSLLIDMLGVAYLQRAARLFAQIETERPDAVALPASCAAAFAPLADRELQQCAALKREFRFLDGALRGLAAGDRSALGSGGFEGWLAGIVIHAEHTLATVAPAYARFCGAEHHARIAARDPVVPAAAVDACGAFDTLFNPAGCMIAQIAVPDFAGYYARLLDLDAQLKLLATASWLRAQGDAAGTAWEQRPQALRAAHHEMQLGADARSVKVRNLQTQRGEWWEIPLAAPAAAPPATAD